MKSLGCRSCKAGNRGPLSCPAQQSRYRLHCHLLNSIQGSRRHPSVLSTSSPLPDLGLVHDKGGRTHRQRGAAREMKGGARSRTEQNAAHCSCVSGLGNRGDARVTPAVCCLESCLPAPLSSPGDRQTGLLEDTPPPVACTTILLAKSLRGCQAALSPRAQPGPGGHSTAPGPGPALAQPRSSPASSWHADMGASVETKLFT